MRIDSTISTSDKPVTRIRMDKIGTAGDRSLWWVAEAFADETTKPEGMFTDRQAALELAEALSAQWNVPVVVSEPT